MENWELVARERVRNTLAAYTHAGDRGRIEDLAATFTEDGVLELRSGETRVGRDAIVAMLSGVAERGSAPRGGAPGIIRHFVANLRFEEITPERIRTAAYFLVMNAHGPDHWGRYRDTLVPVGDRWLFERRFVSVDGTAPGATFGS
ncbi:nuclear transport factor 2 family protein [Spirillospora sp. CA-255316]